MADQRRDERGRFFSTRKEKVKVKRKSRKALRHHDYIVTHSGHGAISCVECETIDSRANTNWKNGRRIVEFSVLMDGLKHCVKCRLGPMLLCETSVIGELKKGLGGYLYVKCLNSDCEFVNCVAYGKVSTGSKQGANSFDVNTKLGTAMIDSVGGPNKVNHLLAALNIPPISNSKLKKMERRAGNNIERVAERSTKMAAQDAYLREMEDIAIHEMTVTQKSLEMKDDDLGISILPDSSPIREELVVQNLTDDIGWTDTCNKESPQSRKKEETRKRKRQLIVHGHKQSRVRKNLLKKFPLKTRSGISCAIDTAWQKRGFDSLTSHTFFMSKAKYGKKVLKAIVKHRVCGVCSWWRRNRPGQPVRAHRCVKNHRGSARLMESASGEQGIIELGEEGIPVEYVEGDGDNTLIARLKTNLNIDMKKRLDKNHVVKNVGKRLYHLQASKIVPLSKTVINHVQKCLKYAFAKNQGNKEDLEQNLKAIIPHQFGDHNLCFPMFCGYKRSPGVQYIHRSLPYKGPIRDINGRLREELEKVFAPVIANATQYADLGSSQQCEHANKEVTLRAPKNVHYGNSESLDFRVQATAAFINEGRGYLSQLHSVYTKL